MARGLGLTALRVALGGLSGVGQDRAAMREAQRVEQEQARALERQSMMDEIMLRDKRFRPAEELAAARQPTGEALSRALSSATAMMRPGGMAGGAVPSLQAGDTGLVQQARSLAAPRERVSLGGRSFEREEAESYRTRMAGEEAAQARMAKEQQAAEAAKAQEAEVEAMVAAGVPRAQATIAVRRGAKYGDLFMTPAEQARQKADLARLGIERERLGIERTRAAAAGAGATGQSGATAATTFGDAANYLGNLTQDAVKKLSARGIYAANVAQTTGGLTGGAADVIGSLTGAISRPEREYLEYAGLVADAWARQSEVGVLTNQDINRYRNQVIFQAGDTDADKWRKAQRAQQWASTLAQMGGAPGGDGQSEANRISQRVQRGMDETGAASLAQRETQAAGFGQPSGGRRFTDEDRARRWDELKAQNPSAPDEQITAQVWREMP